MQIYFLLFLFTFFFNTISIAEESSEAEKWLLPKDHFLQDSLTKIFNREPKSYFDTILMIKLGFETIKISSNKRACIVARHPALKGFVFKFYRNGKSKINSTGLLLARINGAEKIKNAILENQYESFFIVPKKWLWKPPQRVKKKHMSQYLLIAEEIKILNKEKNSKAWSTIPSNEFLLALYALLNDLGLNDSVYIDNIPFTKDGKVAFVDTEHYNNWPVDFTKLLNCLAPQMQAKWQEIIQKGTNQSG